MNTISSVFQCFFKQSSQLLSFLVDFLAQIGCQHQHSLLRQGSFHQVINALLAEPKVLDAARLVSELDEELGQRVAKDLTSTLLLDIGDVLAETFCGGKMSVRIARTGELEDRWS